MGFDPATRSAGGNYHFLTSAVAPRPIAWITTRDPSTGVVNLAPFSWFNAVCASPPMVMVAISHRRPGEPKDTLRNIRASGQFVVHVVPRALAETMVQSSADYASDTSEAEALGLALRPAHRVDVPCLEASPVRLECRLHSEQVLGTEAPTSLVLGEVVWVEADEEVLDERGNLDPGKVVLMARLGGTWYTDSDPHRSIPRPPAPDVREG